MFDTALVGLFKPIIPPLGKILLTVTRTTKLPKKAFCQRRPNWPSGLRRSPHCTSGAMSGIASCRGERSAFSKPDVLVVATRVGRHKA